VSRLKDIDRGLGLFSWVAAGALVLMLFVGPVLIADDEPSEAPAASKGAAEGSGAGGEELFADNCGGCHTLSAAGTTGSVGPSLDGAGLDSDEVASIVSEGRGTMPAFSGDLDDAEIDAIAQFVADSSGS
jgi:mono/diheme cytochrome c family protein